MKRNSRLYLSVLLGILLALDLSAQGSFSSSGASATSADGSAAYSIGQVMYTFNSSGNKSVSSGVQQAYHISNLSGTENSDINLTLTAFPNPTSKMLSLTIAEYKGEQLTYQLFNVAGKLLVESDFSSSNTQIDMQQFVSGSYLIKVLENNQELKSFKVIKN